MNTSRHRRACHCHQPNPLIAQFFRALATGWHALHFRLFVEWSQLPALRYFDPARAPLGTPLKVSKERCLLFGKQMDKLNLVTPLRIELMDTQWMVNFMKVQQTPTLKSKQRWRKVGVT